MHVRGSLLRAALGAATVALAASTLEAQAANYPTFETPRVEQRAFTFAVADGEDWGTQLLFQWREGMSPRMQLGLDAGFGDPEADGADSYTFVGGNMGYQLVTSNANMPLDVMLTAGVNAAFSEPMNVFRVPVGVSVGHRFALERSMAITPYAHPRLIIDKCSEACFGVDDETDFGMGFDLGVNFDLNAQSALRFSFTLANGELFEDQDAFGFGYVWSPSRRR